jgi:hypothetical protein
MHPAHTLLRHLLQQPFDQAESVPLPEQLIDRTEAIAADADPNGPPPLSLLPPPKTKVASRGKVTGGTGKAGTAELQALEQRLIRLEHLVLLIAQQVGVAPEAIERLLPPAAPPS